MAWVMVCLGVLLASSGHAAGHKESEISRHRYTEPEVREDFQILVNALEEAHPGIDRHAAPGTFRSRVDAFAGQIAGPMSELAFLPLVYAAVAAVSDGHTFARPSLALASALAAMHIQPPVRLRFIGGQAFIDRNYSAHPDARLLGARVLAVNGVAMDGLMSRMIDLVPSDADIKTARLRKLENTTTFAILLAILEGTNEAFELELERLGDRRRIAVTLGGLTESRLSQLARTANSGAERQEAPIELVWHGETPLLVVRTFSGAAYERAGIDFGQFVRDAFAEVTRRGAVGLVIDIRDNGGGRDEYGKILVAHLVKTSFDYYDTLELKGAGFEFQRHTDLPAGTVLSRITEGHRLQANDHGSVNLLGHPNLGRQAARRPGFYGPVFVLQNGRSFSVSGEFASILRQNSDAVFIGEEGGSAFTGNVSGASLQLTLPHTKVRISIPVVRYQMAVSSAPGAPRGIAPDHAIEPTISDVLVGRDIVLEFALQLASRAH